MLYFRYDILGEEHGRNTREIHERRMKADKEARAISERMKSLSWDITVLTLKGMGFDVSIYEQ